MIMEYFTLIEEQVALLIVLLALFLIFMTLYKHL